LDISTSDTERIYFTIDRHRSGLDYHATDTSLMDDFQWWAVGTLAGALPGVGLILGPAIGLIPILAEYYSPSTQNLQGSHVWANGTYIDPWDPSFAPWYHKDRGTISFPVAIRFYDKGGGYHPYTFSVKMASWIKGDDSHFWSERKALSYAIDVTLDIMMI
jgi:hypothetical protein